jgi:alcohol dehydrogenase class IV
LNNGISPDFHLPTEIYIDNDLLNNISEIVKKFGTRTILICTSSDFEIFQSTIEKISDSLKESDIGCIIFDDLPNTPNTEDIDMAVSFLKKTNCNLILGFGGINSINAAKAISLLINNYIFCNDLFAKAEITAPPLKFITIPAYPISGFEIVPLFFVDEIQHLSKKAYHNNNLYPVATIVDPSISLFIDDERSMKTAISTLSISTESVISKGNNEIINTYALKAIDMTFRNLPVVFREPQNSTPRVYLSTASVMSGIAFSVAYLSVTLAISLALSSISKITLEDGMSIILPHIMEFNLTSSPGKYVQMSKVMGEEVKDITVIEAAIKAVEAIRRLETDINIPLRLSNYDVAKSSFGEIAELALTYPFITNTPREITKPEIETILIAAY